MKKLPDVISDTYQNISHNLHAGGRNHLAVSKNLIEALQECLGRGLQQLWQDYDSQDRYRCLTVMQALKDTGGQLSQKYLAWDDIDSKQVTPMEAMLVLQFLDRQLFIPARRDGNRVQCPMIFPLLQILLSSQDWQNKSWAMEWMSSNGQQNYQSLYFPMSLWDKFSSKKRQQQQFFKKIHQSQRQ